MDDKLPEKNRFQKCLEKCKSAFKVVFLFSFCVNMLMLITPLYSLQVLDRVIGSGSIETLLWLSVIIAVIHFANSLIQMARSFTLIKVGEWLDNNVSPLLFSHSVASSASKSSSLGASQLIMDFQSVKKFLTSSPINTVLDAPWSIVYVAVVFYFHHYLGYLTIIGAAVLLVLAYFNASATNKALSEANEVSVKSRSVADVANRNAETIEAMGMMDNVSRNWFKYNSTALSKQLVGSYRNGVISNMSRFIRNLIQMAVTGIGGYLVVTTQGTEMSTGGMIASSIIVGRALAPVDQAIGVWKEISDAAKSYKRINWSLNNAQNREENMSLPEVKGHISVDNLYYAPPQNPLKQQSQPPYILKGVNFTAEPGSALAILGPSGSGKSTLARLMVGVWQPSSGDVRLDGAEVYKWNRADFGRHIGYVPQGIELFGGTVKQNIARMEEEVDAEKVVEAAKMAGAHDMILKFPDSYDTDIGVGGSSLSGGQKQRIALARAFYNDPEVLILDEPNANLDEEGEKALGEAILKAKEKNMNIIIISHRPSLLASVDKVLLIKDGSVAAFGNRDDVIGEGPGKGGNNSSRITSKNQ
jgi:ATP-binding cassette subfamily C protein